MALARDRAYRKLSTLAAILLCVAVVVDVERLVSWSLTASSTAWLAASSSSSSLLPPAVPLSLSSKTSKGQVEEEGHALHLGEDPDSLATAALDFVMSRRETYRRAGIEVNWKLRGVGFLYSRFRMILVAQIADTKDSVLIRSYAIPFATGRGGEGEHGQTLQRRQSAAVRSDCDKFTLWVRVFGPEIFAGSAVAVPATNRTDCFWKFDFQAAIPGTYTVDAKVLMWNAKGKDYEIEQSCTKAGVGRMPKSISAKYPLHAGFQAYKMVYPEQSCCEICARLAPYCQYWATPPEKLKKPERHRNGCELYYRADTPPDEIPKSWILRDVVLSNQKGNGTASRRAARRLVGKLHSTPHRGEPQHLLGCGWSFWLTLDFPCLSSELDDQIFLLKNTFDIAEPADKILSPDEESMTLCDSSVEIFGQSRGRWVREPFPTDQECPIPLTIDRDERTRGFKDIETRGFDLFVHDGDNPHCYHRDSIDRIGLSCVKHDSNCHLIDETSYWMNSVARVPKWMGVWRERRCAYVEFTNPQLQQCIDAKKITNITTDGKSVADLLREYINQRVAQLNLYSKTEDKDSIEVQLTTVALLHRVMDPNNVFREYLRSLPNASRHYEYYYVNGYYLSSEREPYTHVERMRDLSPIMDEELAAKGYRPINAHDLSAAWTYDAAAPRDGMHVVGPTMRMIVTKFFHFLCKDVVEGSRLY